MCADSSLVRPSHTARVLDGAAAQARHDSTTVRGRYYFSSWWMLVASHRRLDPRSCVLAAPHSRCRPRRRVSLGYRRAPPLASVYRLLSSSTLLHGECAGGAAQCGSGEPVASTLSARSEPAAGPGSVPGEQPDEASCPGGMRCSLLNGAPALTPILRAGLWVVSSDEGHPTAWRSKKSCPEQVRCPRQRCYFVGSRTVLLTRLRQLELTEHLLRASVVYDRGQVLPTPSRACAVSLRVLHASRLTCVPCQVAIPCRTSPFTAPRTRKLKKRRCCKLIRAAWSSSNCCGTLANGRSRSRSCPRQPSASPAAIASLAERDALPPATGPRVQVNRHDRGEGVAERPTRVACRRPNGLAAVSSGGKRGGVLPSRGGWPRRRPASKTTRTQVTENSGRWLARSTCGCLWNRRWTCLQCALPPDLFRRATVSGAGATTHARAGR